MLRLMHRNGSVEWRYIAVDWYVEGTEYVFDAAVEGTVAHATATMAASIADRLSVSINEGSSYTQLGTDIVNGYDLGAFTPGQRKNVKIKLYVAPGTGVREESIGIALGEGT
jgi:hypothetical protein